MVWEIDLSVAFGCDGREEGVVVGEGEAVRVWRGVERYGEAAGLVLD